MTLDDLKQVLSNGSFHHATYRNHGTIWEGLYIYVKQDNGFNGFTLAGSFPKDNHEEAYKLVRNSGVYEGSYR